MRKINSRRARVARIGDALIGPWFGRGHRASHPRSPARILAVELWNLGDLVLVTPALQALRAAFPEAHVSLLASPLAPELLRHQDVVDEILPWAAPWVPRVGGRGRWRGWAGLAELARRLRARRFDAAIDFRGDFRDNLVLWLSGAARRIGFDFAGGGALLTDVAPCRPDRHQADQALDAVAALGGRVEGWTPKLWLCPHEIAEAACWLEEHGIPLSAGPLVVLHPGAAWEGRRWTADRFARLGDALVEELGARLLLLGGPEDGALVDAVLRRLRARAKSARPSLRQLVSLLASADLFIGSDSGPMHIATAVGTRVVGLFGPQRPEWFGPYGEGHRVAVEDVPCRPCDQTVCQRPGDSCMSRLRVDRVLALAKEALGSRCAAPLPRADRRPGPT